MTRSRGRKRKLRRARARLRLRAEAVANSMGTTLSGNRPVFMIGQLVGTSFFRAT